MPRKRGSRARGAGGAGHRAGPGTVVSLAYELFDAEGERVEHSGGEAPLEILLGFGVLPPSLEHAIEGLAEGASRELSLPPEEAFGARDPQAIIEVDRTELPTDVSPGDELEADRDDGSGTVPLKVLEVRDDVVVLDTNHPLSGQRVRLWAQVLAVRPASTEEMAQAAARLLAEHEQGEDPAGGGGPLLPVERLLKRGRGSQSRGGDEPPPSPPPRRPIA